MVTETIKLNVKDWKIATQERSRDRMKLQIKLSKEDAEAFKNFTSVTKPEEVSLEDFVKAMFLTGIETYNAKLAAKAREYIEANKEKFAEAGVTPENATTFTTPSAGFTAPSAGFTAPTAAVPSTATFTTPSNVEIV